MKNQTIAEFLNVKEFPFEIYDKNGNKIYYETSNNYWFRREFDSNGKYICCENSEYGILFDKRNSCSGKVIEIDGNKYKLKEL